MKTVLEAIQQYPQQSIDTLKARAERTPSSDNRINHLLMAVFISDGDWEEVSNLLQDPWYQKPLEGVIYCLDRYSDIDNNVWRQIVEVFEKGE